VAQKSSGLEADLVRRQGDIEWLTRQNDQLSQTNQMLTDQLVEFREAAAFGQVQIDEINKDKRKVEAANRQLASTSTQVLEGSKAAFRQFVAQTMKRIRTDQARYSASFDALAGKIEILRQKLILAALLIQQSATDANRHSIERTRFLRQIENHLKIIDSVSRVAAGAVHFPGDRIPTPDQMINNPSVLHAFGRQIGEFSREMAPGCSHTRAEVDSFLRRSYL
jgi:hypothetical protein